MSNNETVIDQENINGICISLKVESRRGSPNSRLFTITYKNKQNKSSWAKGSLYLAIVFNILSLFFVRTSLTAISMIVIVLSFLVWFWISHSVQSESLLVIPTVGMQSSVKYVYGREDNFVPWSSIDDVIINEVIKLNRVLYYLTILVKANNNSHQEPETVKLIPLFKYTKPRLLMLETIYAELQNVLIEAKGGTSTLGSGDKEP